MREGISGARACPDAFGGRPNIDIIGAEQNWSKK
tara:strand:- start:386 stop:487 length:102 start_codon:yes stop_codon:yes gene_type:complete